MIRAMTMPNMQARRCTVDDRAKITELWKSESLPAEELENRFKEFQIVEGEGGEILGAMGFQIAGQEGRLHSEAFAHPEQADELRALLWERFQIQAKNHGLVRVWTQLEAPFWHTNGLKEAPEDVLAKLPPAFAGAEKLWLYLQLREDKAATLSVDQEFMLFKESEREGRERLMRQAKIMRFIAVALSIALFALVVLWAVFFFKARSMSGG
jgi:N-acetylglutamate synthase-like GNAT family acetyltransferase